MKTDQELKQLAADIFDGKVFTDQMINKGSSAAFVFLPITLGALKDKTEEELKDIGMIYEYLDQAGHDQPTACHASHHAAF